MAIAEALHWNSGDSPKSMKAIVTGSGGLIGSECARTLCQQGWEVAGVDNDMRREFFGDAGTTTPVVRQLVQTFPNYKHFSFDIRDRQGVRDFIEKQRPDFIIHTAAQPSHDRAAVGSFPLD
jgi:CDP-paratose 2-epimerase